MVRIARVTILLVGPLVGFGALQVSDRLSAAPSAQSKPKEYVQQPETWTPFSADIRRVNATNGEVHVGRFYRSADGSTRSDTGPSLDHINMIGIKNVAQAAFFTWNDKLGWTQQPMTQPPEGWRPGRVVFNERMTRVAEKVDGLDLIKHDAPPYTVYRAPQLNMFDVVKLLPCQFESSSPCGTWLSNIRIGEQPPGLFTPPTSASVNQNPDPGGIRLHKPPPAAAH